MLIASNAPKMCKKDTGMVPFEMLFDKDFRKNIILVP